MHFDIITIFPKIFDSYFSESILARAQKKKLIEIKTHNLRDYADDKRKTVDDTTYGGGQGMVLKVEPIYKAIENLRSKVKSQKSKLQVKSKKYKERILLFSAKGKRFSQRDAKRLSKYDRIIMICGRYEGVDERVAKYIVDEEISIGEFVMTGGEIPAMTVVDAVSRLIPGVVGKRISVEDESFAEDGYIEYPHYTKPEIFSPKKGVSWKVPGVLLGGNHKEIERWRKENAQNMKECKEKS